MDSAAVIGHARDTAAEYSAVGHFAEGEGFSKNVESSMGDYRGNVGVI